MAIQADYVECPNGMSLTLGISQCKDCSNEKLYLVALLRIYWCAGWNSISAFRCDCHL